MSEQLLESVRSQYAAVAESTLSSNHAGVKAVAQAFGYTPEELTSIPAEANLAFPAAIPRRRRICGSVRPSSTLAPGAAWTCSCLPSRSGRKARPSASI